MKKIKENKRKSLCVPACSCVTVAALHINSHRVAGASQPFLAMGYATQCENVPLENFI